MLDNLNCQADELGARAHEAVQVQHAYLRLQHNVGMTWQLKQGEEGVGVKTDSDSAS